MFTQSEIADMVSQAKDLASQLSNAGVSISELSRVVAQSQLQMSRMNQTNVDKDSDAYKDVAESLLINQRELNIMKLQQSQLTLINEQLLNAVAVEQSQRKKYVEIYKELDKQRKSVIEANEAQQQLNQQLKTTMARIDRIAQGMQKFKDNLVDAIPNIPLISQSIKSINFIGMADRFKEIVSQFVIGTHQAGNGLSGFFKKIGIGFKSVFKVLGGLALGLAAIITGMLIGGLAIAFERYQRMQVFWLNARRSAGSITGQKADFAGIVGKLGGMFGQGDVKAAAIYGTMRKLQDVVGPTADQVQILDRKFAVMADTSAQLLQNLRYGYGASKKMSGDIGVMASNMAVMMGFQPQKVLQQMADASAETQEIFGKQKRTLVTNALFARKMNTSLQQMTKSAKGFLDVQNMIEAAMEIQLLTGKELDVGRMLSLTAQGKGAQAFALAVDAMGDSLKNVNPLVAPSLEKGLGMDMAEVNKIYAYMKDNRKTATEAYNEIKNLVGKNMNQSEVTGMLYIKTRAAEYLSDMQKFRNTMVTLIYNAFGPLVKWLMINVFSQKSADKMKPLFSFFNRLSNVIVRVLNFIFNEKGLSGLAPLFGAIGSVLKDITAKFIAFINNKQGMAKLSDFIKQAWQYMKKLAPILSRVFKAVWQGAKWIIDMAEKHPKGVLAAVVGIALLPKVLKLVSVFKNLATILKGISAQSFKHLATGLGTVAAPIIALTSVALDAKGATKNINPEQYRNKQTGLIDYGAVKKAEAEKLTNTGEMLGGGAGAIIGMIFGGPMGMLIGQQIGKYIGGFIADNAYAIRDFFKNLKDSFWKVMDGIGRGITSVWDTMKKFFGQSIPKFFTQTLPNAFKGVIDTMMLSVLRVVWAIFQRIDAVIPKSTMQSLANSMLKVGQDRANIPKQYLPKKASGAGIYGTTEGQHVVVGERNQDEAIVPLPQGLKSFLSQLSNYRSSKEEKQNVNVNVTTPVHVYIDGKQVSKYVKNDFVAGSPAFLTVG